MNYVNIIRRLKNLQRADARLSRLDDGENMQIEDLRCNILAKISMLVNDIDIYLCDPHWTFTSEGLIDAKKRQVETAMRLLGVSRRTMGWR